ncbi:MAG: hybrid sensor histidine kinase/response regulator [Bacteroidota bacterium]
MKEIITIKKEVKDAYCILLVDDRMENLLTLENVIEKEGRSIIKVSSGNEALKIALSEKVDLILLDVQMPEMDGYEVADLLRMNPKTKNIPIVFVSAVSRNEKGPMNKFEEGTVDFLFKPLDIQETKSKVALFEKIYSVTTENKKCFDKLGMMTKEMDHFVYIVSHDIKSPLRAIDNLATWITDDLAGTENQSVRENISLLKNRINRMQRLMDGISEFSSVGRINESKEPIDINKLIQYVIDTLVPPQGFKFEVQENLPVLFAEKTKLIKIFTHLINNSIIHHHKKEGIVSIMCSEENNKIRFTIKDDGPGIKPQYFGKVFEIFHTLVPKDHHETSGVGLSIVKKIIESHGEKVWFNAVDSGTEIIFTWKK